MSSLNSDSDLTVSIQRPNLTSLPPECLFEIVSSLQARDVAALAGTCRTLNRCLSRDNLVWRGVVRRDLGSDVSLCDIYALSTASAGSHGRPARTGHQSWKEVCRAYHLNARTYMSDSRFPAHRAVEEQDTLTALYLIRNAPRLGLCVGERDLDGISVLDTAASVGDVTVTRVLCTRGMADASEKAPDGWTPLMKACCNGDVAMARMLLELGAHRTVNAQTSHYRWTALHYACKGGHFGCVRVLLEHGADKNKKDFGGRTALELLGTSMSLNQRNCNAHQEDRVRIWCLLTS